MVSYHLDTFLSGHVFAFTFIFARVGSAMMLMPGIGESYVPVRVRLMFTLALCLLLLEPLIPHLPTMPASIADLTRMLFYEIVIGLFFGTTLRLLLSALEASGTVVGLQTGLSSAPVLNPTLAAQSPLPSALLSVLGVTLIFVTGLDHFLLRSLVGLYDVFPPGGLLLPGDMAQTVIHYANKSFALGIELAMPFFVIGLLLNVALGLLQKLLPQVQMFLVAMPIQIWGGLMLFALTVSSIVTFWLHYVDESVVAIFFS